MRRESLGLAGRWSAIMCFFVAMNAGCVRITTMASAYDHATAVISCDDMTAKEIVGSFVGVCWLGSFALVWQVAAPAYSDETKAKIILFWLAVGIGLLLWWIREKREKPMAFLEYLLWGGGFGVLAGFVVWFVFAIAEPAVKPPAIAQTIAPNGTVDVPAASTVSPGALNLRLPATEFRGYLQPRQRGLAKPRPKGIDADTFEVQIGPLSFFTKTFPFAVLQQEGEDIVVIDKTEEGLSLTSKMFNVVSEPVCLFNRNRFDLNPGKYFTHDATNNTLKVYDHQARDFVFVDFIDNQTVKIDGNFYMRHGMPVVAGKEKLSIGTHHWGSLNFNYKDEIGVGLYIDGGHDGLQQRTTYAGVPPTPPSPAKGSPKIEFRTLDFSVMAPCPNLVKPGASDPGAMVIFDLSIRNAGDAATTLDSWKSSILRGGREIFGEQVVNVQGLHAEVRGPGGVEKRFIPGENFIVPKTLSPIAPGVPVIGVYVAYFPDLTLAEAGVGKQNSYSISFREVSSKKIYRSELKPVAAHSRGQASSVPLPAGPGDKPKPIDGKDVISQPNTPE